MVDRLERAGYVHREADPRDRRRVIIQPAPERLAAIAPHYQAWPPPVTT
jgi:DNA-binding MarR family transcriptional regulator